MLSGATDLATLASELRTLHSAMLTAETESDPVLSRLTGAERDSAVNLTHYLAFRSRDVRALQRALADRGLSSLGRAEGHVMGTVDAVLSAVAALSDDEDLGLTAPTSCGIATATDARQLLATRTTALLGEAPRTRPTRIMVTMPSHAAEDASLVQAMTTAGMDVARINGAHDDQEAWLAMIRHVRAARRPAGAPCRVLLDLPGPKSRTGALPEDGKPLKLHTDDVLTLVRDGVAQHDPPVIECSLALAFERVVPGDRVVLDDGKLEGIVETNAGGRATVRITRAGTGKAKLRAEKGINFPDTDLSDAGMPIEDLKTLVFAAEHADLVGLSFVNHPRDIRIAREALDAAGGDHVGLVLKIETAYAFDRLPDLLVEGLTHRRPLGVMIARGDLAVEVGAERLAEVQEEVLWLGEAAHVPVIWATQVLEGLAKTGFPSRAEITDAAMGSRAECVMLNKGPEIVGAIVTLDSILHRMAAHQDKKTPLLRRLTSWD